MMLEVPEPTTIVKSRALVALSSMTLFTWMIEKDKFVTLDQTSPDSQQTVETLKQWVRETSADERKKFFDTFFGLFLDAGITSINDLRNLKKFLQDQRDLSKCSRPRSYRKGNAGTSSQATPRYPCPSLEKWQTVPRILVQMAAFLSEKKQSSPPHLCSLSTKIETQQLKKETTSSIH